MSTWLVLLIQVIPSGSSDGSTFAYVLIWINGSKMVVEVKLHASSYLFFFVS